MLISNQDEIILFYQPIQDYVPSTYVPNWKVARAREMFRGF